MKWEFQVAERDGRLIGCSGMAIGADGRTAHFCWGMVDRTLHRQGIGTALVRARLDKATHAGVCEVLLDTSQHSGAFYERLGFRDRSVTADGYGPGLDRCDMVLTLWTLLTERESRRPVGRSDKPPIPSLCLLIPEAHQTGGLRSIARRGAARLRLAFDAFVIA